VDRHGLQVTALGKLGLQPGMTLLDVRPCHKALGATGCAEAECGIR
jgi:hypothetical protein